MSILNTDNLSLSFGDFDLFHGITVSVANDSKIGLIGPNGVGKTSLLLILAGIQQATTGRIHMARGRRMGYLRQEAMEAFADRENTVYSEMLSVFGDLIDHQAQLNALEAEMAAGHCTDELLERYGELQTAFEQTGGYDYELRIQQTLAGLGLDKKSWHMPLRQLSGGQKTRALLARLLLEKPDLLMLDEPTNHLDMDAVEWLERTLREWQGSVLIVSHDRYFLDNTVNTIWEMSSSGIEVYSGNYSAYLLQRTERWEYYERVFKEEKARLTKEVDFIQKYMNSNPTQALGRLRRLTRDLAIVENYGILSLRSGKKWSEYSFDFATDRPLEVIEAIRKVNAIQMPSGRPASIRPRLSSSRSSGTIILRAREVTVGFPNHPLFSARNLELRRGEFAALIGPNGSGKTTFLRTMLGQVPPLKGEVELGASLQIGYFAQAHDALRGEHSVLVELQRHKSIDDGPARSYLAQYQFRGEDVYKQLNMLSGGERARLALAVLALDGANFLMLDEPTNHLDIPAQEALQDALSDFPGTILLVSHDRYLIDRLASQIWELRDRQLHVFTGTYREYTLRRAALSPSAQPRQMLLKPKPMVRDNSRETRKRTQNLALLEERIRQQEASVQRLYSSLHKASQQQAFDRVNQLSREVAQAEAALENLLSEWEKLAV